MVFFSRFIVALGSACVSVVVADEISPAQREFFEQRIRPILVDRCYECHNSSGAAEAGLALDHRQAIFQGSDTGPVLAKSPEQSRLLQVIRHEIEGLEMPEGGPRLADHVIADFETWLAMGAPDPRDAPPSEDELAKVTSWEAVREKRQRWWSFQPVQSAPPPKVNRRAWPAHPLDQFVLHQMEAAGLSPAPEADRRTLIRRLYFALVGLPPTPGEVDAFVADPSEDAYEKLVDRLLESEHFGERWARHWMDWVRYAESHGSEGDPRIEGAYQYRDYLIRALNTDVPYDQLLREHVAGDLLDHPRVNSELGINESILGTIHWRMVFHGFAPTDALDEKVRFNDDAIDTFSKAFLGLTVSCARCHNHKFDAISQADYYALFGILGSTRPGRSAIEVPQRLNAHHQPLESMKVDIHQELCRWWKDLLPDLEKKLTASSDSLIRRLFDSQTPQRIAEEAKGGKVAEFSKLWRGWVLKYRQAEQGRHDFEDAAKAYPQSWDFSLPLHYDQWYRCGTGLAARPSPAGAFALHPAGDRILRGIYPAGVYSHLISDKHAARLTSGDFRLNGHHRLWLQTMGGGKAASRYVVQTYPRSGTVYPVTEFKQDGSPGWSWQTYDLKYWDGDDIHIELTAAKDAPLLVVDQERSWFGIRRAVLVPDGQLPPPEDNAEHLQPLMAAAEHQPPDSWEALSRLYVEVVEQAVDAWSLGRITDSQALLLSHSMDVGLLPNTVEALPKMKLLVDTYRELEKEIPVATRVPTLAEWRGADQPLFERGDHKRPKETVPRRFLEVIDTTPYGAPQSGREQLAEDMLREDNPFTSRVIVNRIWHHLFGRGIVASTDNLGRLGSEPSHPELLDYLAHEFRAGDKWSIKNLVRKIVTSKAYRQASLPSPEARQRDPENLLISHFNTRRLDAEAIRDSLLSVSGRLEPNSFGPSVPGTSRRRSVYVAVIRNALDPFLNAFDAPVPSSTKGRREVTNVPAQSLMLLNSEFVQQLASDFANSLDRRASAPERVRSMWRRALGREPTRHELQEAQRFLEETRSYYDQIAREQAEREAEFVRCEQARHDIVAPVIRRLTAKNQGDSTVVADMRPVADWRFDSAEDLLGDLDLQLKGSAKLTQGQLVLDGGGWAHTGKLGVDLAAKSLEVVVKLDTLQQAGGGVMTVQTTDGHVFDAIVYAERQTGQWLAGSNHFQRTQDLQGPADEDAHRHEVHLLMVYDDSGRIRCYRNGQPYGRSYPSNVQRFAASNSMVVFGLRHGTQRSKGRMLQGRILEARLYDRALNAAEATRLANQCLNRVTRDDVRSHLSSEQLEELVHLESRLEELRAGRNEETEPVTAEQPWADLAHALFNMKEFIYVR